MADRFVPGLSYGSPAHELWALVIESFRDWEKRVSEAAAAVGLSPVAAWVLVQLDPEDPTSQKGLAARLHCNPSTVVDPTDRLEEHGLVIRKSNPADRRVNVLIATAKGKQVRAELIDRLFAPPEAFRRLSAKEQARFRDVMLTVVRGTRSAGPSSESPAAR